MNVSGATSTPVPAPPPARTEAKEPASHASDTDTTKVDDAKAATAKLAAVKAAKRAKARHLHKPASGVHLSSTPQATPASQPKSSVGPGQQVDTHG